MHTMDDDTIDKVVFQFSNHVAPLGPFGEQGDRERKRQKWIDNLSSEEVIALLIWVRNPTPLPGWARIDGGLTQANIEEGAVIAGTAGRRLGDPRIRQALEAMLSSPDHRERALVGLEALADPECVPALALHADSDDKKNCPHAGQLSGRDRLQLRHGITSPPTKSLVR